MIALGAIKIFRVHFVECFMTPKHKSQPGIHISYDTGPRDDPSPSYITHCKRLLAEIDLAKISQNF